MSKRFAPLVSGLFIFFAYESFIRAPARFLFPVIVLCVATGVLFLWLRATFIETNVPYRVFFSLVVHYLLVTSVALSLGSSPLIMHTLAAGTVLFLIASLALVRDAKGDPRMRPAPLVRATFLMIWATLFFSASVARGVPIFLQKGTGLIFFIFVVNTALLWYYGMRLHALPPARTVLYGIGFVVLAAELFWVSSLLPIGVFVAALPTAMGGALFFGAARDLLLHTFEQTKFLRRTVVSVCVLALLLVFVPWS